MTHISRDKSKLLARVRRIRGQAAALEKRIEEGGDHTAVLQQIAAIRGAVNGLMAEVMEGHVAEHLVHERQLKRRRKDLAPVLQVIKSYLK